MWASIREQQRAALEAEADERHELPLLRSAHAHAHAHHRAQQEAQQPKHMTGRSGSGSSETSGLVTPWPRSGARGGAQGSVARADLPGWGASWWQYDESENGWQSFWRAVGLTLYNIRSIFSKEVQKTI